MCKTVSVAYVLYFCLHVYNAHVVANYSLHLRHCLIVIFKCPDLKKCVPSRTTKSLSLCISHLYNICIVNNVTFMSSFTNYIFDILNAELDSSVG